MARLIEPITESIDSLTRRFVRQNRELTRANATQSIKIRALENQVSNLLTENLALRETVLHLHSDFEQRQDKEVLKNVCAVQKQLESKLKEIANLVQDLGSVDKRSKRRKSQLNTLQRLPRANKPRSQNSLGETNSSQEGQLPTIVEGKSFPRKTLDFAEIAALNTEQISDSPDIGPPPTMFLDHEESALPQPLSSTKHPQVITFEDVEVPCLLSANFETRRKRRETYVRSDDASDTLSGGAESGLEENSQDVSSRLSRAGVKRKLDVKEIAHQLDEREKHGEDLFDLARKGCEPDMNRSPSKASLNDLSSSNATLVLRPPVQNAPQPSLVRKALGPKSANLSPRKVTASEKSKEDKDAPAISFKDIKELPEDPVFSDLSKAHAAHETDLSGLLYVKEEPQTPALINLVSPPSTQPSQEQSASTTGRPTSPRPPNVRGSRRARPQVSYAEPNLISKMRRPTKDLVDAVARDSKLAANATVITSGGIKKEDSAETSNPPELRTVLLDKIEPLSTDWKPATASTNQPVTRPEPQSPLRDKDEAAKQHLPDRTTNRERRRSTLQPVDQAPKHSTSSVAISALLAPSRKTLDVAGKPQPAEQSLEKALENLDIYDIKDSSPPSSLPPQSSSPQPFKHMDRDTKHSIANINTSKHAPRPHLSSSTSTSTSTSMSTSTTRPDPHHRPSSRSTTRPTSRRQTLSNTTTNTTSATNPIFTTNTTTKVPERWTSGKDLQSIVSAAAEADAAREATAGHVVGKAERGAGRRRSMML